MENITHPTYSGFELHLLPHQRIYDVKNGTYLPISEKNTISVPVQTARKINFDKFILECKLNRKLTPNEIVSYIDGDSNNHSLINLDVKVKEVCNNDNTRNIIVQDGRNSQTSKIYGNISRCSKDTLVSKQLIKACCNKLIHETRGKGNKWYTFEWENENDFGVGDLHI